MIFRTQGRVLIVLKSCLEQFGAMSDQSLVSHFEANALDRLAVSDENDIMGEELRCLVLLRVNHNREPNAFG